VGITLAIAATAVWVVGGRARRVARELGARSERLTRRIALGRDVAFYFESLDALARAGCEKPRSCTPRMHVQAVQRVNPAAALAFAAVVDRFYEIRYGGMTPSRAQRAAADALIPPLRAALARG
jgi:hypothetical protein